MSGSSFWTWTCMVCKDERPDSAISVAHHHVPGLEALFPDTRTNIRYCNDNVECARIAHDESLWEYITLKEV